MHQQDKDVIRARAEGKGQVNVQSGCNWVEWRNARSHGKIRTADFLSEVDGRVW